MSARLLKITTPTYETWENCLEDFIHFKAAQGRAKLTIQDYQKHISGFFRRFPDAWEDYNTLKKSVIAYFADDVAPATHNIRRAYLKSFFNWCLSEGILPANPIDGIPRRKDEPRVRHISEEQLRQLLEMPRKDTYPGLRDYAMLLLVMDSGIRPKEMLSLMPEDVNLESLEVYIRKENAKTRKSRTLPISPVTGEAIRKLLSVRPKDWQDLPLFCTCEGRPMTHNAWRLRLNYYGKKLGFKVSPYDFRHAFALMYLKNGGDPFSLQRIMGHSDMSMTKRYVNMLDEDVKQSHSIASPVQKLVGKKRRLRKL